MKKALTLLLSLVLACACMTVYAEGSELLKRTIAPYHYALTEEGAYVENLIFHEDVIISGDNAQIIFVNCAFNRDVVLTANEGTRVLLLSCDVNGTCVLQNDVREASLEYNMPKFLVDTPVTAATEACAGTFIAMGDFTIELNGEAYSMASAQFFSDAANPDAGLVAYEGQEASYFCISQWYENDQLTQIVLAEYDPSM